MSISIIVPCFNEEESLMYFYKEFIKLSESEELSKESFELILVDDGSKDGTLEVMRSLAEEDLRVHYISFMRNFGKEAAIYAGLQHSKGDYVAIMDADLQDPPALLPEMYRAIVEEGYDSVATRRVTRKGEPPIRSFFAKLFYRLMSKISKVELVDGARDYRLMNRNFVDSLLMLGEYNRFSKGMFGWVGGKTKWLEFENVERIAGETKWSFKSLLVYAIDGIVAFSTAPLVISTLVGVFFAIAAFVFLILIIVRRLIFGDPVAGWASMVCIMLLMGGIQMFCIGIVSQYLAKTYLEVKHRPVYLVKEKNTDIE